MGICIYCNKNKAEHFICELCGDGMCEECYNKGIENDKHIQDPSELDFECVEIADIIYYIFGDGFGCEKCINDVLNKLSIISTDKCKKE